MTTDEAEAILVEHGGGVSTVTLNRPEKLNSMQPAMVIELMAVLARADLEPSTKVIVLTGAGRGFCGGADVASFGSAPDHRVHRRGWHLVHSMLRDRKPIIAKVNGAAAGLGLVIALLSDCVIATEDAKLGDPHVKLGLVAGRRPGGDPAAGDRTPPGQGAVAVLQVRVGPRGGRHGHDQPGGASPRAGRRRGRHGRRAAAQPVYALRATKAVMNRYVRAMANDLLDVSLAYEEISRGLPEYPEAIARWRGSRS